MSETRYFEFKAEHGIDYDGNLEPITEIGLSIPTRQQSAIGLTEGSERVVIRPAASLGDDLPARVIPDTRIIESRHPLVSDSLLSLNLFDEVKEPTKGTLDKARKETKAHVEAMRRRDEQVAAGHEPAPDATDQPNDQADGGQEE